MASVDVVCDLADISTTKDESHYLEDPELFVDILPQPFRRINRILNLIVDNALDIAEARLAKFLHDDSRRSAPMYDSADILEVLKFLHL